MNHYPLLQADMDTLANHLELAVYDINEEHRFNMALKLQGLGPKMALLRHNLEAEAEKLGNRVDDAAARSTETFAKSNQFLDATHQDLADVEKFIAELDAATKTNGGPALDEPAPPPLPAVEAAVDDTGEVIRPKLSV